VAGNNAINVIDQDGICETKSPDGVGDLDNLLLRMGAGIGSARL
jgi:hypothetical protein